MNDMSRADGPAFIVTAKFITEGQSHRGGWTKRQLQILGFSWPPQPGWRQQAVGRSIPSSEAREFLALRKPTPGRYEVP